MRDLQRRLGAAGHPATGSEPGTYCARTEEAVRSFQQARGLRADGRCDEETWAALVEASWRLGGRQLFLTLPHLRGDDVVELQSRLTHLGFDCGRVDGILGPRTAGALSEFQSNCGLVADGICGVDTIHSLQRLSAHSGQGPGVATVREQERLRQRPGSVGDCRVVIGQYGGLSALTRRVTKELRQRGATAMPLDEPDSVAQALAANHFHADVYIGFDVAAEAKAVAHFYKVPSFESVGGRALAEVMVAALEADPELTAALGVEPIAVGMRLPVLRETKMPAVVLTVGPARVVGDSLAQLAAAILRAVELWSSRAS